MTKGCVDKDLISGFLVPSSFKAIFPNIIGNIGENVQKIQVPDFSIGFTEVATPVGARLKVAGDSVTYSSLTMTFVMDQNLVIYDMILKWMKAAAYPEDPSQFDNFASKYAISTGAKETTLYQTFTLVNTSGTEPLTWVYYGFFPVAISGIEFDTTLTDATVATVDVTFEYSYFDVHAAGNQFSTEV